MHLAWLLDDYAIVSPDGQLQKVQIGVTKTPQGLLEGARMSNLKSKLSSSFALPFPLPVKALFMITAGTASPAAHQACTIRFIRRLSANSEATVIHGHGHVHFKFSMTILVKGPEGLILPVGQMPLYLS